MYVLMYVCMCVCVYECMYVLMYVCMCVRIYVCIDVCIDVWLHLCMYVLAWLAGNCGRIGVIGSSPSNGLKPNLWDQKGFNPLCQCVYIYVCIVKPDIQTIHRCSHTSIHTTRWQYKLGYNFGCNNLHFETSAYLDYTLFLPSPPPPPAPDTHQLLNCKSFHPPLKASLNHRSLDFTDIQLTNRIWMRPVKFYSVL